MKEEIEGLKQELIKAEIQNGVKQIPFPSGTPLKTDSTVSENEIQSIPITVSSGAKEQVKEGGGEEEKKMKEKTEKKGEKKEKKQQPVVGSADSIAC